jgi:LEA14-like dessication related protein
MIVEIRKMKNNKIFLIGGGVLTAGVIAYFLYQKKQAIKSLNVNVTKVDYNKSTRNVVVFVRMINPSNASLRVKSIVADVYWKGSAGATIDYRTPFELKPLEEKTIELPVKLNLELVSIITDILTGKFKDAISGKFELKGNVNAEGLVVPLEYTKEISFVDAAVKK